MAITSYNAGSATIGTSEYSMVGNTTTSVPLSNTGLGIYQCSVDLSALAAGDQFQIKIYEAVYNGTQNVVDVYVFTGVQAKQTSIIPSVVLSNAFDFTVKKLAGTDRTIKYDIYKIA